MSRQHVSTRPASFVAALLALAGVAMLAGSCSSKSSSAPSGNTGGPTLAFTFPAGGTPANPGTSHQSQFTAVGSWDYHCIPHQTRGMTGTVLVDPSSVVDSALVQVGGGSGFQFVPPSVTIKQNGFVRWVNVSSATNHTVTRP